MNTSQLHQRPAGRGSSPRDWGGRSKTRPGGGGAGILVGGAREAWAGLGEKLGPAEPFAATRAPSADRSQRHPWGRARGVPFRSAMPLSVLGTGRKEEALKALTWLGLYDRIETLQRNNQRTCPTHLPSPTKDLAFQTAASAPDQTKNGQMVVGSCGLPFSQICS